ncbi:MAG: hypothetical protein KKE62_10525 [Proteobacteria bacterium]|nr:hypothetical protein [Pseudomonadota bacterium]MBU1386650.1 hypothetical protein [Pseudomonadota bacterium]MBU1543261.1 hypothetical protein [Pseudomonadota bacterium]MBU2429133.1 hypothetical protein [Pseudomonadota bacterium]MBU2482173.1 hypothetical protein [Pseudomonadota bacterium]
MSGSFLKTGQFYASSVIQLLIEPGLFFWELPEKITLKRTLGFMMICSVFFAGASLLTGDYSRSVWKMAGIFFINAFGMMLISSFLGYVAMVMVNGRQYSFSLVLGIYAFSWGLTLFLSWLPFFVWLTEPWKWWLIYTGFRNTCGISRKKSLIILVISMTVQFFLIYSALLAFVR